MELNRLPIRNPPDDLSELGKQHRQLADRPKTVAIRDLHVAVDIEVAVVEPSVDVLLMGLRPATANHVAGALGPPHVDDGANPKEVQSHGGHSPFQTGKPNHRPVQQPQDFGVGNHLVPIVGTPPKSPLIIFGPRVLEDQASLQGLRGGTNGPRPPIVAASLKG